MIEEKRWFGLSGNVLKIIAAVIMFIDHLGEIIFPNLLILRIIGRLAFPIFAYMIYEGTRYTRNKIRYLLQIFILGALCMVVQLIATGELYLNVLLTFSFSISIIFAIDYVVKERRAKFFWSAIVGLFVFVVGLIFLAHYLPVDYGIFGILLPVFPYLLGLTYSAENKKLLVLDPRFYAFAVGLVLVCVDYGGIQYYALISLVLLALYNGKRGFRLIKYFFYVFYPAHLALLWGINFLIMAI